MRRALEADKRGVEISPAGATAPLWQEPAGFRLANCFIVRRWGMGAGECQLVDSPAQVRGRRVAEEREIAGNLFVLWV